MLLWHPLTYLFPRGTRVLVYITIAKCSFTVFDNMIFDSGQSGCNMVRKNGNRAVARILI